MTCVTHTNAKLRDNQCLTFCLGAGASQNVSLIQQISAYSSYPCKFWGLPARISAGGVF